MIKISGTMMVKEVVVSREFSLLLFVHLGVPNFTHCFPYSW